MGLGFVRLRHGRHGGGLPVRGRNALAGKQAVEHVLVAFEKDRHGRRGAGYGTGQDEFAQHGTTCGLAGKDKAALVAAPLTRIREWMRGSRNG